MKVFRLHRLARWVGDYTCAMLAGGRWNRIGTPMLYAAQYLSLACIEVLVHLDKSQLPQDYVWSSAELPGVLMPLEVERLEDVPSCQAAGDSWIRGADQLAVEVPSVIIPAEFNVLLNPHHATYKEVRWGEPRPFDSIRVSSSLSRKFFSRLNSPPLRRIFV